LSGLKRKRRRSIIAFSSLAAYNAEMQYQFPSDIRDRLQDRLKNGLYADENDVLRDAMDALDQSEQEKLLRWQERNRLAAEQSRQGLSRPLDDEAVLARLRERLAREGILG
jgi:Arc/MetJ-type ribon-helix-helix transcriptional regulator